MIRILHDATSIVHTWTSRGYLLSSIIQENFILSLKKNTYDRIKINKNGQVVTKIVITLTYKEYGQLAQFVIGRLEQLHIGIRLL